MQVFYVVAVLKNYTKLTGKRPCLQLYRINLTSCLVQYYSLIKRWRYNSYTIYNTIYLHAKKEPCEQILAQRQKQKHQNNVHGICSVVFLLTLNCYFPQRQILFKWCCYSNICKSYILLSKFSFLWTNTLLKIIFKSIISTIMSKMPKWSFPSSKFRGYLTTFNTFFL